MSETKKQGKHNDSLHGAVVGQRVWLNSQDYSGKRRSRMSEITHIDQKGRLFICLPTSEFVNNWRYGFKVDSSNPRIAKAARYSYCTMCFATPEEINEQEHKEAAEAEEKRQQIAKRDANDRIHAAAPELLDAVKRIETRVELFRVNAVADLSLEQLNGLDMIVGECRAAIAKAESPQ